MDFEQIEKDLTENGSAVYDCINFVVDEMNRIKVTNGRGRCSFWGKVENGKCIWHITQEEFEKRCAKNRNVAKTTIGTHVSEEEFVEIARLCELLGISRSKFCYDALITKIEATKKLIKL